MQFASTRNLQNKVSFSEAVLRCIPDDGGMYVPAYEENMCPWIYYANEKTSFSSIAGSLTSALLKEELSPVLCENIAAKAFSFSPELRRLDNNLYSLELYHTPTGSFKDFGVSYLASCLEHILIMQNKNAIVMAVTSGETGSCIAHAFKNKKRIKAVLLYAKGTMRSLEPSDYVWNGGNIYPVEINGDISACYSLLRLVYSDLEAVQKYGLTLANTVNVGRLLPQTFFYTYAFSRLKKQIHGDIYYALSVGNFSNLVAGLYGWKFSLPVHGFVINSTPELLIDSYGKCMMPDSEIPLNKRNGIDFAKPSNLERLEEVFFTSPAVLRGVVFPVAVSQEDENAALKELYVKYGYSAPTHTARAFAAAKKRDAELEEGESATILLARNDPAFESEHINSLCGSNLHLSQKLLHLNSPVKPEKKAEPDKSAILRILEEICS